MLAIFLVFLPLFAPASDRPAFHFAIVGDRTGRAVPGVYENAWREVAKTKPDFVLTVGDAIEGMNSATARDEWNAVKRNWVTGVPLFHTPGNHDIWDTFSEKLYVEETGRPPYYSFDFHQAHFIVLDNSRTEDLSAEQMNFLRRDLEQNKAKSPTFILFHRAFWLIPLMLRNNGFVLHQLARQYGVCCVISGHGHQFKAIPRDGVLYLEVGSSGASLSGAGPAGIGYDEGWFYQYVYATVSARSVRFEVRELSPPYGEGRVRTLSAGEGRAAGAGQH